MNVMSVCMLVSACLVLWVCWDVAERMSWSTRHTMRLAMVLAGLAACLTLLGQRDAALLAALTACGLHWFFSRRAEVWRGRTGESGTGDGRAVAAPPDGCAGCAHEPVVAARADLGRGVHLAIVRADAVSAPRQASERVA